MARLQPENVVATLAKAPLGREGVFFFLVSCSMTFACFKLLGMVLWTSLYGTLDFLYSALTALDFLYSVLDMNFSLRC
jgi:hypothetical protein